MTSEICGKALGQGSRLLALHLQERRERSVHAAKVQTDRRGGDRRMLSDWRSIPVGLGEGGKGGLLAALWLPAKVRVWRRPDTGFSSSPLRDAQPRGFPRELAVQTDFLCRSPVSKPCLSCPQTGRETAHSSPDPAGSSVLLVSSPRLLRWVCSQHSAAQSATEMISDCLGTCHGLCGRINHCFSVCLLFSLCWQSTSHLFLLTVLPSAGLL